MQSTASVLHINRFHKVNFLTNLPATGAVFLHPTFHLLKTLDWLGNRVINRLWWNSRYGVHNISVSIPEGPRLFLLTGLLFLCKKLQLPVYCRPDSAKYNADKIVGSVRAVVEEPCACFLMLPVHHWSAKWYLDLSKSCSN